MNAQRTPIDPSLMTLDSGIFDALPREVLPLEIFRLESYTEPVNEAEPLLLRRRRHDSLVPSALDGPLAAAPRRSSWAVGLAVAAGAAIVTAGALHAHAVPAPAAAVQTAPVVEAPAPVLAAAPAPVTVEQKPAPAPAPIAAAPRAFRPAVARPAAIPAPPAVTAAPAPAVTADLDRSAVSTAVAGVGQRSASCLGEPGTVNVPVAVTFAPSGRVTSARVTGGPLVGTPSGACLAGALRGASVPAFAGDPVTVNATVRLR